MTVLGAEMNMELYVICEDCGEKTSPNFAYCEKCGTERTLGRKTPQSAQDTTWYARKNR
ncbi:MAG: hypothetical protein ACXADY_07430 [Candidatus Hodarchaeales archaeon]